MPLDSLGAVSNSYSIATMAVSLAVSTNATATPTRQTYKKDTARRPRLCIASHSKKWLSVRPTIRVELAMQDTNYKKKIMLKWRRKSKISGGA